MTKEEVTEPARSLREKAHRMLEIARSLSDRELAQKMRDQAEGLFEIADQLEENTS